MSIDAHAHYVPLRILETLPCDIVGYGLEGEKARAGGKRRSAWS